MNKETATQFIRLSGLCYPEDDEVKGLVLNMNDTWCWGSAWGEEVPDDQIIEVARLLAKYGDCGLLYWASERNKGMRSEFEDINRFVDFVREEERLRTSVPESTARAYKKHVYTLGNRS